MWIRSGKEIFKVEEIAQIKIRDNPGISPLAILLSLEPRTVTGMSCAITHYAPKKCPKSVLI
jgi:hypothetical protein